ncbi:MAG: manganese catalase family protein [Rhizobacter sp.]|nr:manganese catalase family protein [Rhizobacter sp.]
MPAAEACLAKLMLEQFGGPDGGIAAALRGCSSNSPRTTPGREGMPFDIAIDKLGKLEVIGNDRRGAQLARQGPARPATASSRARPGFAPRR